MGSVPEQGTPQDREAAERMKAEILRRVEEMDAEDAQSEVSDTELGISPGKGKARDVAYEEELEMDDVVRVRGDGSAESESDEGNGTDDEKEGPSVRQTPETVLELAFIRDPKLFDRDAKTRRDKARTDLKTQTGEHSDCRQPHPMLSAWSRSQDGATSRSKAGRSCSNACRRRSETGFCRNTSSEETVRCQAPRTSALPRLTRLRAAGAVAVGDVALAVAVVVAVVEAAATKRVSAHGRTRTRRAGATTTGSGGTTRRWPEQRRLLSNRSTAQMYLTVCTMYLSWSRHICTARCCETDV
jgi:hypothetical protein